MLKREWFFRRGAHQGEIAERM